MARNTATPMVPALVLLLAGAVGGFSDGFTQPQRGVPQQAAEERYLPLPADPDRGGRLFISKGCIRCHAVRGEGGTTGPDLGRSAFGLNLTEITAAMWNHAPTMGREMQLLGIEKPSFAPGEMSALVAFLYYLNFGDSAGDPERGRVLFESKSCARCHALAGRGSVRGPSLDRLQVYASPVAIAQRMWNHGPQMLETMRQLSIEVPTFTGDELGDLTAYLRATGEIGPRARRFTPPGDARRGQQVFEAKGCVSCHAIMGRGAGIGPDLAEVELGASVTELAARLWNHWPRMWEEIQRLGLAQPLLTEEETADLLAFLYSIHYSGQPGVPQRGATLFVEKGCRRCHGDPGAGGDMGPDLSTSEAARSFQAGVRLLWNHAASMEEHMLTEGLEWPRFTGEEISDLLSYLRRSAR